LGNISVVLEVVKVHNKLYGKLYGRKKIQKLVFLVEHLNLATGRAMRSTGLTGYSFKVWVSGPVSWELHEDINTLVENGYLREEVIGAENLDRRRVSELERAGVQSLLMYEDDGYPKVLFAYSPRLLNIFRSPLPLPKLPGHLKHKIELVVEKYGSMTPDQLEDVAYDILWMTREKKLKYLGYHIDDYLFEEKLA